MPRQEIRFRCWDKIRKQLVYQFIKKIAAEDGTEYEAIAFRFIGAGDWSPEVVTLARVLKYPERYDVMQLTCLEAKDVDIYAGDIIENDSEWWKVVFEDGRFVCVPINGGNVEMDLVELAHSSETNHCGNIYENPELIKN